MPNQTNEVFKGRFELKSSSTTIEDNHGQGAAGCIGNMDRGGDVIFPGAFRKCIKGFLKAGFIALGHDWTALPIGMPEKAKEAGKNFECEWEYHTHEDAQKARNVAKERIAKGLDVGLSIGFAISYPDGRMWFESGEQLLKYAKDTGQDMSLFDAKGIKAWKGMCRAILEIEELFEFSQVTVPMNPSAVATSVKGAADVCEDLNLKSQSNTVAGILQAKIHQAFTIVADELAVRGYMDTDERIALSSNIGDALKLFRSLINSDLAARSVDAADVDWIASKSEQLPDLPDSSASLDVVTWARALKSQSDFAMATL